MPDEIQNFGILDFDAVYSEMATDAGEIVQLDPARVQQLIDATSDQSPQFPILRVEGGTSGNGNHWSDEILRDVAEQINREEPVAYLGHIKPEDDGYAFPEPQTIWLKAVTRDEAGKTVLYVKGYNFPQAKIREYLRTGVTRVASWRGKANGPVMGGVRYIKQFKLESFDWSRKGKQGMSAHVVALATEMEGSEQDVEIGKLTLAELQAGNPSLVDLIKGEGKKEAEATISEMEPKVEAAGQADETFKKLRDVLGIDDSVDIVQAVGDVVEKVENTATTTLREKIADIVGGKVKGDRARSAVMRLVPVSEMEGKSDDDLAKSVEELFDTDEDIKAIVSEMEGGAGPLTNSGNDNGKGNQVGKSGMITTGSTKL
jgi:hypothetical protein